VSNYVNHDGNATHDATFGNGDALRTAGINAGSVIDGGNGHDVHLDTSMWHFTGDTMSHAGYEVCSNGTDSIYIETQLLVHAIQNMNG
jgi:hypothetical protein